MSEIVDIFKRINELIDKNNITGVQLGKMLGLRKSPLTDWKNSKSKPTLEQIITICDTFATSSDYIIFGKEHNAEYNDDEIELLMNYKKLDSRGKHKLHTVIYEELDRCLKS